MEITKTTKHTVTFTVEEFASNEGGMDHDRFGEEVTDLKDAIELLQLANAASMKTKYGRDWIIAARVKTEIK